MAKRKAKIDTKDYKYGTLRIRDAKTGRMRYSSGNADAVAKAMLIHVADGGTMKQVIDANKLDVDGKNTNVGLVRMAVGVALRGKVRHGEPVKIGKLTVKSLKQKIALPKVEAPVRKAKKAKPAKKARKPRKPKVAPAAAQEPAVVA